MRTLKDLIDNSFSKNRNRIFLEIKLGLRIKRYSYWDIDILTRKAANIFEKKGLKKGDKVLLWGMNSPEWAVVWIACARSGIVVVPADYRTSFQTAEKFVAQTKPKLFFVSRYLHAYENKAIILEDLFPILDNEEIGKEKEVKPDDLVEIVYTSGTTGTPKGVMLSHKNILASVLTMRENFSQSSSLKALSVLPLSHILEQVVGLLVPLSNGSSIAYLQRVNSATIIEGIRRHKATAIIVVPRILSLMLQAVERKVEKEGKTKLFNFLLKISPFFPRKIRKILFRKIHSAFGSKLEVFICGGAPLEKRGGTVLDAMGFRVIQGYGSTETSGLSTINVSGANRMEYAGVVPKNASIEISADGEVLVKGDFVSRGYYGDEEKTKSSFEKGWYKTGDIGIFENKWLKLFGRDKFRIVLPDGRKVYPEDIETKLGNHPDIKAACVVPVIRNGEKAIYAAILTDKKEKLDEIIKDVNKTLENSQQISYYGLWEQDDFPRTSTLKVDREEVEKEISQNKKTDSESEKSSDALKIIISNLTHIPLQDINDSTNIVTGLKLDSLGRIELISQIEAEIGVSIDESKINSRTTVGQIRKLCKTAEPYHPVKRSQWQFSLPIVILRVVMLDLVFLPLHSIFIWLKTSGKENVKKAKRPCIFYPNHIGTFDIFCVLRVLNIADKSKIIVAVSSEEWKRQKFNAFIYELFAGAVPIDREGVRLRDSLEFIAEKMDEGYSLIIFPEGKVSEDGSMAPLMKGIGLIASELGVDAVPMKINPKYRDVFPFRGGGPQDIVPLGIRKITFSIGEPLNLEGMDYEEATTIMEKKLKAL